LQKPSIMHKHCALLALVGVFGCSPHNPPPTPSTPVHPMTMALPGGMSAVDAALPKSPDVGSEVMGWLVVSDGARLAQQLSPDGGGDPQKLQTALLTQLGLAPDVASVIDLKRPLAIALLNPSLLAVGAVQPYVAMVPIRSRAEVEKLFSAHRTPVTRTPWGLMVPTAKDASMSLAFRGPDGAGYALVAWRPDLLAATE
jgi:hypothetical protein